MMNNKTNRQLLPNIKFLNSESNIFEYSGKDTPLEQAIANTDKSLFLVAKGGQGKTTTLRTLWLDFLRGKNDIPCLYVDCKLLNKGEKDKAIHTYIKSVYGIDCAESEINNKIIILLDGANEANAHLRQSNEECNLVKESKTIINQGFRLVISGRSSYISEYSEESDSRKANEFDESFMQYCELCELTDRQLVKALGREIEDSHLCKLLKNNMMLSMYLELNPYSEKIDSNITAGKLLERYFNICFKTRFIQSELKLDENEEKIFEIIKEVEAERNINPNKIFQDSDKNDISEKISYLEKIYSFLTKNSCEQNFTVTDLSTAMYLPALERLSILQKTGEDEYAWANEVYQEYFEALRLKNVMEKLLIGDDDDYIFWFRNGYLRKINSSGNSDKFRFYKYAGEIMNLNRESCSGLIKKAAQIRIRDIKMPVTILSILSCEYVPAEVSDIDVCRCFWGNYIENITVDSENKKYYSENNCILEKESKTLVMGCKHSKISKDVKSIGGFAFADCREVTKIVIPTSVTKIGNFAFMGCRSLIEIVIPSSVTRIEGCAFAQCDSLPEIKIPSKVERISDDIFIGCKSLRKIYLPHRTIIFDGLMGKTNVTKYEFFLLHNTIIKRY